MSKSARGSRPKLPFPSSPSASSISGGKPNQGLEAMLHVTQVHTSCADEGDFYYYPGGGEKSQSELSMEVKTPDLEAEVPLKPPFVALVSNLPMECYERELSQVFSNFSIRTLTVPRKGKRPKAFAYLEMNSREELIRLLQLEKLKCRGRLLSIKLCPDPEKIPSGGMKPGERGGGGGVYGGLYGELGFERVGGVAGVYGGASAGAGDAPFTPLSISDYDSTSAHYAASVSDLNAEEPPSSPVESPRAMGSESSIYNMEIPIRRKPSTIDELERRMDIRLQKLAEFENAQSEREQSSQMDDDQEDIYSVSWTDILNEARKSEQL
ncbi:uncharacterized protein [Drosophila kikkawai]|uniref:RRM domain-containing protein n=1 Tax=Drosophila kikkawai TaxID=30033 RepID=A0A6P4IBJ2_DROKI|nr:uncharacterized protein LOC108073881 [Drosophila kikkawai]